MPGGECGIWLQMLGTVTIEILAGIPPRRKASRHSALRMKRRSGDRPDLVAARRQPLRHLPGILADPDQLRGEVQSMNQNAHWPTGVGGSVSQAWSSSGREQKSA